MRLFIYKTIFVFVCIFLLFQFTIGTRIKQLNNELEQFKSQKNINNIKDKLRKELRNANNKENYLTPEDAKLINDFINKLTKELSNNN